jgi:hypothetical protein
MVEGNWVTPYIIAKMERVSCYVIALIVLIVLFFFIVTFVVVYISELNFPSLTIHNTTAMNPWLLVIRINHKVKKPFKFKILQPFGFLYFLFFPLVFYIFCFSRLSDMEQIVLPGFRPCSDNVKNTSTMNPWLLFFRMYLLFFFKAHSI